MADKDIIVNVLSDLLSSLLSEKPDKFCQLFSESRKDWDPTYIPPIKGT